MKISSITSKTLLISIGISSVFLVAGCNFATDQKTTVSPVKTESNWKQQFDEKLPLLGHRNWILIVDKAFPEQNAPGMEYIYANDDLLPVLKLVLGQVNQSTHVKPIIYRDKELGFIKEEQAKGVTQFIQDSKALFGTQSVQTLLHDEVFKKLDAESKLFKVLVIKTNETIPYTSVFLQLDCGYWNADKESQLRTAMGK
jgi:D-ribose pyranose/furanose isomerase RbsD